ncbi:tetratricopeptide repeat-containing sensor histidine kinase [Pedobacter sp. UBA5917]|jgi:signal transduction histidine kinase|uniref:tetratricopeptide repeat-containing sensor histidine kinase n=1 Tax=Pedobacter sp. UBA5917 TaxID=1947061 RepID=UPI0025D693A5|nr:tetratricopeptide repeat-containing sensor histidine kinase [Pedobacter sp. UBA5917]
MRRSLSISILLNCLYIAAFAQGNLLGKKLEKMKATALAHYKLHQTKAYIDTLNRISYLYYRENPDSNWAYAEKAYKLSIRENYLIGQARARLNFSGNYYYKYNYVQAFKELNLAYRIAIKTSDPILIATCLNNIGLAYVQQKNYAIALKHFYRSLDISTRAKDLNMQMLNHFNLGFCNSLLYSKYKTSYIQDAIKHYQIAQTISKKIDNLTYIYTCYNRLGELYILNGDYKNGIKDVQIVLSNKKEISDWELGIAYTSMAQAESALKKYDKAINSAELGYIIAKRNHNDIYIDKSLSLLAKSYQSIGNFKKAYHVLLERTRYAAVTSDEEAKKRVNDLLIIQKNLENQYLTKEIAAQEKNIQLNRLLFIITIFFLALVSVLLAIVYRKSKQKSRLNRLLADTNIEILQQRDLIRKQNTELKNNDDYKNKLLSVIGHDLRSPFASTLHATKFFKDGDLSLEELNLFIDDFQEKILNCLVMLNDLLAWTKNNNSTEADKKPYQLNQITDLVIKELVSTISLKQINLNHHHNSINDLVVVDDKQVMVILRNLITNAIKFTKPRGTIEVFYTEDLSIGQILLHIKDNGIGMDKAKASKIFAVFGNEVSSMGTSGESGTGIGLSLVNDFAKLNDIKIQLKTEENVGTEFILGFKQAVPDQ